jgi:hypothetical protein
MPNYTSIAQVTLQNRREAYEAIADFFLHLDALNVNLSSLTHNQATQRVNITTNNAIPESQLAHLGIEVAP